MGAAAMLFMLLGLDPRADVLGHAGGFVTGLLLAGVLRMFPALSHDRRSNVISAVILAGLVLTAWKCALPPAASAPHG